MQADNNDQDTTPAEERNSYWNRWYALVAVFLLIQVSLYYFITVHFR